MARVRAGLLGGAALAATLLFAWHGIGRADPALDQAVGNPNNWPMYGRDYTNDRFSPLTQITDRNVGGLKFAWAFSVGSLRAQEATPIVIGDTLYISSSDGPKHVYALDAKTGRIKWQYDPVIAKDIAPYVCCDVDSRGLSFADGKIIVATLDSHLIALDAKTGNEAWNTVVVDYKQGSTITSPPLIVKNLALSGYGGGEYGARGAIQAFDIANGKRMWKTWTIPGPGEPGNDTWKDDSWKYGGGTVWNVGSYDPKTNTVFFGTSNPGPWNAAVRSTGTSNLGKLTNAGSSATLAIDPDTGKIKWEIQSTAADAWDYDGITELVLGDLREHGHTVPVYMKADRNGFFFVANRDTGKLLSAKPFVPVNWARSFNVVTDRAIEIPIKRPTPTHEAKDICPSLFGGKNWQPMSFSPETGLVYIPANNMCMGMKVSPVTYHRGTLYMGNDFQIIPGHGWGAYYGRLLAWNPVTQRPAWEVNRPLPWNGGTMTTAGNLVFSGDILGFFHAYDAKTGKELWKMNLGSGIVAGPISFAVDGKQYVAVLAGRSQDPPGFMGLLGKKILAATPEGGTLFVFSL
jgi:PQQ-dependent dehydrogenase (methanol/ethanol family)